MVETQLNILDTIVIAIMLLSTLIAFFRGFVKEILSLGAWLGAAIITIYCFPKVAEWLTPRVNGSPLAINLAATLGTYITALIAISIVNSIIIRYVKTGADVGVFDNMLGLMFGALRGAFIVSLGFMLLTFVFNADDYPEWIAKAKTRPYVEEGAAMLAQVAPHYLSELSALAKKEEDPEKPEVIVKGPQKETNLESAKDEKTPTMQQLERLLNLGDQEPAAGPKPSKGNQ